MRTRKEVEIAIGSFISRVEKEAYERGRVQGHPIVENHVADEKIQEARLAERTALREKVEKYFRGLIFVPDPQATKEELLGFLQD